MNENERSLMQMQRSFVFPHLINLKGKGKPDAKTVVMCQSNELVSKLCKVPYDYLLRDNPEGLAECALLVWEYLEEVDLFAAYTDCYNYEAEAAGAKILFFPDHQADIDRAHYFIRGKEDLDKIKFHEELARIPYLARHCEAFKKYIGIPAMPFFSGPWSLASNLYGLENLVVDCLTEPEFAHELLRRIVDDLMTPMYVAVNKAIPDLKMFQGAEAYGSAPMVSLDLLDEFVRPYARRVNDNLKKYGLAYGASGMWGFRSFSKGEDRERFLEITIDSCGSVNSLDPDVSDIGVDYFIDAANRKNRPLTIGLGTAFLEQATPDEVVERVKHYLLSGRKAKAGFSFMLNNITPNTSVENINALIAALKTYTAPDANESTPLISLEKEPFENFLKRKVEHNEEGYEFSWLEKSEYAFMMK